MLPYATLMVLSVPEYKLSTGFIGRLDTWDHACHGGIARANTVLMDPARPLYLQTGTNTAA